MEKAEIVQLKKEISALPCSANLACFLLYGSIFKKKRADIKDTDIIIVLKDVNVDVDQLFDFILKNFPNPDFHIYAVEEIKNDTAFFSREYVMEYLSQALCIYGKNVFKEKYKQVSPLAYKRSVLIRSIEHVQMVRKVIYSNKYNIEHKLYFLKKYIMRLAKNILLFKGILKYNELDTLTVEQVLEMLKKNNLLKNKEDILDNEEKTLKELYGLFCRISSNLVACKKELT